MAGGASGTWANAVTYSGTTETFAAGACGDYDPVTWGGEYAYIQNYITTAIPNKMFQFNISAASLVPWVKTPAQTGTATQGMRMCVTSHVAEEGADPEDKLSMIYLQAHLQATMYRSDITG
jgi:hypothetical protein